MAISKKIDLIPRNGWKPLLLHTAAFVLPALLILLAFVELRVFPFGKRSLLVADMNNEYIDYFMQMNKVFREGGSFLHSWDMGMGLNMLGLVAFYTASPLNIIILLSSAAALTEAVLVVTVLKVGLCGLFFSVYASHTFSRKDLPVLFCSVAYAMMGYNIVYSSNIMWLDGVYMLPLVLMGVEKLLGGGSLRQFVISLVIVFVASYYIGYMVGVFTFLYFTARYFTQNISLKEYFRKLRKFLGGALLAALLCMVLLWPTFLQLWNGQDGALFHLPKSAWKLNYPITTMLVKLLPGTYDTLMDAGLPNIYTTVAVALLAVLFFLNAKIALREKLIWAGVVGVMLLSFSWGVLNIAWHAFEVPTWYPARYSFVYSFLLLYLALSALREPGGLTLPRIAAGGGVLLLLFLEVSIQKHSFVQKESVKLAIFLTVVYAAILCATRLKRRMRLPMLCLMTLLVCSEAWYAASSQLGGIHSEFIYRERNIYYAYRDMYLPVVEAVEEKFPGQHRIEIVHMRNANGGMALGYKGISHYSTTTYQALNLLLRELGYNTGTINELYFSPNTPFTNGLLGIKYVLSREDLGPGYCLVDTVGEIGIYENTMAFPLAYFSGEDVLYLNIASANNSFALQNLWITMALLEEGVREPFHELDVFSEEMHNLVVEQEASPLILRRNIAGLPSRVETTLHNPEGFAAYAFFPVFNRKFSRTEAYVNNAYAGRELSYRHNTVLPLGVEEFPTVTLELTSDTTYMSDRLFYGLDVKAGQDAARAANANALVISRFEDSAVDGIIVAPRDGVMLTSFPYDKGWSVWVDGKKVDIRAALGVFLAVELPEGRHEITMRYSPPGFRTGVMVSLMTLAGIAGWHLTRRKKPR